MRNRKFPLYLAFAVPFTLQVLGIVSLVGYLSYRSEQKAVAQRIDQLLAETRDHITHELDHYLTLPHQVNRLQVNAVESGAINPNQLDVLHRYLIGQHRQFSDIADLGFATPQGELLVSYHVNPISVGESLTQAQLKESSFISGRSNSRNPTQLKLYSTTASGERVEYLRTVENPDVRERSWYRRAIAAGKSGWTKPFQEQIEDNLIIRAYTPFYNEANTLEGVFFASVNLEPLSQFLSNLSINEQGQVFIVNRNGFLVATSSGDSPRISVDESANPILKKATQQFGNLEQIQAPQVSNLQVKEEEHLVEALPYKNNDGLDWLVITVIPKADFMGEIKGNLHRTIGVSILALVGSFALSWWSSRRIARSLRSISEASQDMPKGNLKQPLPETPIQELETLRQSFQEMAQSLQTAKAFQENHQHRLKRQVKKQTTAIREREAQLQLIIDSIPACIAYTDSSLRYQFVNQTYEQWYHSRKEDILGHTLPEVIGEEAYRRVEDDVERALTGETVTFEAQLPNQGKTTCDISVVLVPDYDQARIVKGYYALITDITEQKKAEQALQAKETHLRQQLAMIEAAAVGIGILEGDTYFYLNRAHVNIFGYDNPEELLGKTWREFYPPEEIERLETEVFPILERDGAWKGETLALHKNGSTFPLEISLTDNEEGCRICICQDITARKEVEQELEATTEELDYFFSTGADLHGIGNTDGYLLRLNKAWETTLGYPLSELEGEQFLNYVHRDDIESTLEAISDLKQRRQVVNFVNRCRCQDGTYRWLEWQSTSAGNLIYAAARDITERKETEQQLIAARDTAKRAAQLKSEFLATMSHEIRTPMNGVIGMLQVLQNSNLTSKQRSQLDIAYASAESLLTIINDILDFSKIDAGKLHLETTPFFLQEELEHFAQTMALSAQEKGLELVLDLCDVPPRMVKGDPLRLKQILTNLVSNAIKFTEAGEILIRCELNPIEDRLRFTARVQDTGIGIAEDKLTSLFDPFTQADASTTRHYGGTGLGLAIVKKLCHLMAGNVSVDSKVGQGSCFSFDVMLEPTSKPPLPREKLNQITVLVVAKNQSHRQTLARQLQAWGITVITAAQGKTALSLSHVDANAITFALIDYHLPDQPGIELAQRLQQTFDLPAMHIMLMTPINYSEPFQSRDSSIYCTLTKPIVPSALWQAITFPKAESFSQQQKLDSLSAEENIASTRSALRILLVEDDQMNQLLFKAMIESYALQVDIARHGKEALQRLQKASSNDPYDLVFMDCQMPEMDGYETTRQIRAGVAGEDYQTLPIIAMTAYAMTGDPEKCFAAGMDDYISKPLAKEKVMAVLEKWLAILK